MNDLHSRLIGLQSGDRHLDALRILLEVAVQTLGVEEGSILLLDAKTQELVFLMTGGDLLSEWTLKGQRVKVGEGLTGLAAKTGEVQAGAPTFRAVQQPDHHDFKAPTQIIAAPMLAGNLTVGAITAASYQPNRAFSGDDKILFKRLAGIAGIVISDRKRSCTDDDPLLGLPTAAEKKASDTVWV